MKKLFKGVIKGIVNIATGGLVDRVRESKLINELEKMKTSQSATPLYLLMDMLDDGTLNNSVTPAKAENTGKAIGGVVVAIVLLWNLIKNGGL